MQFQYSPYILPLLACTIIAGFVAIYGWQRRAGAREAIPLVLLALACGEWALGYALEIAGADLSTKIFWGKSQYIGIGTVPLLWVIFASAHSIPGIRLTSRHLILLSILPLITIALAFTTDLHGLIWSNIQLDAVGTFSALKFTHGFWFWVYLIYSYVLLTAGTFMAWSSWAMGPSCRRRASGISPRLAL